jgi:hypothetical protein
MYAMDKWRKLRKGEDITVITYMTIYFDANFAKAFLDGAKRARRLDTVVHITNVRDSKTPGKLKANGYRFLGKLANSEIQVWADPVGNEYWLVPNSKPVSPDSKMPEDPAVEEARLYVNDLKDDQDGLRRSLKDLRNKAGSPGYKEAYDQFWDDFNRWQNELNETLETTVPDLEKEIVLPRDRDALKEELKRLETMKDWKLKAFLPELSRNPPPTP